MTIVDFKEIEREMEEVYENRIKKYMENKYKKEYEVLDKIDKIHIYLCIILLPLGLFFIIPALPISISSKTFIGFIYALIIFSSIPIMCIKVDSKIQKLDEKIENKSWEKTKKDMLETYNAEIYGTHLNHQIKKDGFVYITKSKAFFYKIDDFLLDENSAKKTSHYYMDINYIQKNGTVKKIKKEISNDVYNELYENDFIVKESYLET